MLSAPPTTGNTSLDTFLKSVYEKSIELEQKALPEDGWSLTDLTADVAEVVNDRRDLIDIVTKYDEIETYVEAINDQKVYLDSVKTEIKKIDDHAGWFTEIMEWWDQNYRIIQDAGSAMASANDAKDYAAEAEGHAGTATTKAEEAKGSSESAAQSATDASTSAGNAATSETNASEYESNSLEASAAAIAATQILLDMFEEA